MKEEGRHKEVSIAGKIASADSVVKTVLFILHERIWAKVRWGKEYAVEYNI